MYGLVLVSNKVRRRITGKFRCLPGDRILPADFIDPGQKYYLHPMEAKRQQVQGLVELVSDEQLQPVSEPTTSRRKRRKSKATTNAAENAGRNDGAGDAQRSADLGKS